MPAAHPLRFPYRSELLMPVVGMEAEFKVFVDEVEIVPEALWRTPSAFITRPLLYRSSKASQLPTGGAVYFDGGVIEVVTPVIEIAPRCSARVVRSLWEQTEFVRDQLDGWAKKSGSTVRLQAFSCHYNVSFELAREERNRNRTIQKLALLLAHILPIPLIVTAANRRSTGIGVRPRRDRIEITLDFTPDPGLMAAAAALIIGMVREVIEWPSYRLDDLAGRGVPIVSGIDPSRHATRNGWIVRGANFPQDPFTTSVDAPVWEAGGRLLSARAIALEVATFFRESIRRHSDSFSERVLFSVLDGTTPSLLNLADRPSAYDDVGGEVRWGTTIPELVNFRGAMDRTETPTPRRRRADRDEALAPPWSGVSERRETVTLPPRIERRQADRRSEVARPRHSRLERSRYETVFRRLGSGKRLQIGDEVLTPVGVRGWYHAIFETPQGEERVLTIDQVLEHIERWRE
jgi:hypothetical protein